jgi:hypothetical protein
VGFVGLETGQPNLVLDAPLENIMSQGAYPISRLLQRIIAGSGLRRSEFVQAIGYKNATKGLRRLDEWLEDGSGDDGCLQKIIDAFHPDPLELEHALAETERIRQNEHDEAIRGIEDRERRRFRPFIWIETEDGAHSFLTAIAERQLKVLRLPVGLESLSGPAKLEAVRQRVREHYQKTTGRFIGFGKILSYRYASDFDHSALLDIDGNIIDENAGRFLLPEVWMELHR